MKRAISLLLVLVMLFGMVPVTAFAAEESEVSEAAEAAETAAAAEETEAPEETQATEEADETEATEAIQTSDEEAAIADEVLPEAAAQEDVQEEAAPVCNCGTDDASIHATSCALYEAPAEPVCYCVEKCTEVNEWCDVCGFDYAACAGEDTAMGYAASGTCGDNLTWTLDDAGTLTISGTGAMKNFASHYQAWDYYEEQITAVVVEDGVTTIGNYAFCNYPNLISISLPETLTTIGIAAFGGCTGLTGQLVLPNSLKTLDSGAFGNCTGLTTVIFGDNLTSIGMNAFSGCTGLDGELVFPDSVQDIGNASFQKCTGLDKLTLGSGVTRIGHFAFQNCTGLDGELVISDSVTHVEQEAFYGCTGLDKVTLGGRVNWIGVNAFYGCTGVRGEMVIPDSVVTLNKGAFSGSHLDKVTFGTGLTTLGEYACYATEMIFTNTTPPASINNSAFGSSVAIVKVPVGSLEAYKTALSGKLPSDAVIWENTRVGATGTCGTNLTWTLETSGTLIISGTGPMTDYGWNVTGPWKVYKKQIRSVVLEEGITRIGECAFNDYPLLDGELVIPDSVTTIGYAAFNKCSGLDKLTLGCGLTTIDKQAFFWCAALAGELVIPDNVTTIGGYAFANCAELNRLILGSKVQSIGEGAFSSCTKLSGELVVPDNVHTIGGYAFDDCSNLKKITFGSGLTLFGTQLYDSTAISNCSSLTELVFTRRTPPTVYGDFTTLTVLETVHVPQGTLSAYTTALSGKLPEGAVIKENITYVAEGTCGENLTWTLNDEGTLTISGTGDMYNYSESIKAPWSDYGAQIKALAINEGVTQIGDQAFRFCSGLTGKIVIPDSVTTLGSHAFFTCTGITSVDLGEGVVTIKPSALQCGGLTGELVIPDSVTSIGYAAFRDSTRMTAVTFGKNITTIGTDGYVTPFFGCSGITEMTFTGETPPKTIYHSFGVLSSLKTVWVPTGTLAAYTTALSGKLPSGAVIKEVDPCATGHTEVIDEAVPATCTETGLTEGKHCSVCGEILVAQEVVPAGHDYEEIYTAPTFEADGFTTYTCTGCGDTYTENHTGTMKTLAASIDDEKYETLAEAFGAATAGDTIVLLKSYTVPSGTTETWDLSGKTLEISSSGVGIIVEGNLTISGGTFNFLAGIEHILVRKDGHVIIGDGTFYVTGSWGIWAEYGVVKINGGTFYVTGSGYIGTKARPSGSNQSAMFIINDGTFYFRDNARFVDYGNSIINGGTFYLENNASILAGWSNYRDPLDINGGTFYIGSPAGIRVDLGGSQFYIYGGSFITIAEGANILKDNGGAIGIYGGTFSQDMTPYMSGSNCCRKEGDYYVVGKHVYDVEKATDAYLKNQANCTTAAEYYLSCVCGQKGTATFFYGGTSTHSFTNYVSNDNATCTGNGTETAFCDGGCGTTDERESPNSAKGHAYENGVCTACGESQPGSIILRQPESVEVTIGQKFAITVEAEGNGLTYQWYYKDTGMKEFKISSNKTSAYAYTMQTYMHNRQVYCVIADQYGNSVTTKTATITRPPVELAIKEEPQDVCVNIGEKFSVKPSVQGDSLTYQWYYKDTGMKEFKVSSNKTSAYAYTMQTYMHNRQVYCVITDANGNQVTTETATITRPPLALKITQQPQDVQVNVGDKFSISPKVEGDGLTYQWYYKESYQKAFSASSNKTSAYAYAMQSYMNGRSVYCVITDQYGNQVQTEVVTIYVK